MFYVIMALTESRDSMRKQLIHIEYLCILNLIALPFFIMLVHRGSMMIWPLFIFLDGAKLLLRVEERSAFALLRDPQLKAETIRIKIYLAAILAFYLCMPFVSELWLLVVMLLNNVLSVGLSYCFQRYIYHDEE